jgi:membrane fusion protein, copper/silver efflux system
VTTKTTVTVLAAVVLGSTVGGIVACRGDRPASHQAAHADEYFCPMHPKVVREKPGDCPVCGMKLEKRAKSPAGAGTPTPTTTARRVLFYRHPMNPSVHSDSPAKDDMGMDFVPVYEDEAGPGASFAAGRTAVTVPPERAALLGIRSEPASLAAAIGVLRSVGRVAVDERRLQAVHAKLDGYVEALHVDFTGQPVRKGQALLEVYSPELVAAQKEYLVAQAAVGRLAASEVPGVAAGGQELLDASRQRLQAFDMSPRDIAALEERGAAARTITLRSPVAGVVVSKLAVQGMKVSSADRLYELADLSRVWVLADVFERDAASVRAGMSARVSLPGQAELLAGQVTFVSPVVKPETRTFEARVEVDNARGLLKLDMFVEVVLETPSAPAVTVPESAVVQTGERALVFVDQGGGRYEPREIALGRRVGAAYEVRSGVSAGERVVVSANFLLDSESSLRAAIARAAGGK